MKQETLNRAKALENDIDAIAAAIRVSGYGKNSHYESLPDYGSDINACLPSWLNDKINTLLTDERTRLMEELEALTDDSETVPSDKRPEKKRLFGNLGIEPRRIYLFDGCNVCRDRGSKSWLERNYNLLPLALIFLDIMLMGWLCCRFWDRVFPVFDVVLALNILIVMALCMILMVCIENHYEAKNKEREDKS